MIKDEEKVIDIPEDDIVEPPGDLIIREHSEFKNKGWYLDPMYNYRIGVDSDGIGVLVRLKKK